MSKDPSEEPKAHNSHHGHGCSDHATFRECCLEAMKVSKLRVTKPRLAVIECLERTDIPLSPKSIFEAVKASDEGCEIDQVSVYRILEALNQLGLIHQIFPSGDYLKCHSIHTADSSHVMLNCLACGKADELPLHKGQLDSLFSAIAQEAGFSARSHIVQVNGMCQECTLRRELP